ncbi:MAG TPA: hypothetical protein VFU49_15570 [Ktedonobacteraceae bacterium]|nr:hypothetical protein [Ktedonobacteraceae bacterium]
MSKRSIRWILPIVVILMIATFMVLSPIITTHAAGTTTQPTAPSAPYQSAPAPKIYWYY